MFIEPQQGEMKSVWRSRLGDPQEEKHPTEGECQKIAQLLQLNFNRLISFC